jgi:hypothetical protein
MAENKTQEQTVVVNVDDIVDVWLKEGFSEETIKEALSSPLLKKLLA